MNLVASICKTMSQHRERQYGRCLTVEMVARVDLLVHDRVYLRDSLVQRGSFVSSTEVFACYLGWLGTILFAQAPGGGFLLGFGALAEFPKVENLKAMVDAAREYGVYRK